MILKKIYILAENVYKMILTKEVSVTTTESLKTQE